MDGTRKDAFACMTFAQQHRAKLHSANPVGRPNGKIRQRIDVARIFPHEAAIRRPVGAILREQGKEGAVRRFRYMTLETLAPA